MNERQMLEEILCEHQLVEQLYDHISLIDPATMRRVAILKSDPHLMDGLDEDAACYKVWDIDTACANCVAARSLHQNKSFVKIEFRNDRVFMVFSAPIVQDALTRLFNEEYIQGQLPYSITKSIADGQPLALLYIKLENINSINLQFGLAAGDQVLRECAKALRHYARSDHDWSARHGDTGFILVLRNCDATETYRIAKRIHAKFQKPIIAADRHDIMASVSIGCHVLDESKEANESKKPIEAEELIRLASRQLVFADPEIRPESAEQAAMGFFRKYLLTAREDEVAFLLLKGLPNAEIAQTLYISLPTVKKHVSSIFEKADVDSRAEFSAKFRDSLR